MQYNSSGPIKILNSSFSTDQRFQLQWLFHQWQVAFRHGWVPFLGTINSTTISIPPSLFYTPFPLQTRNHSLPPSSLHVIFRTPLIFSSLLTSFVVSIPDCVFFFSCIIVLVIATFDLRIACACLWSTALVAIHPTSEGRYKLTCEPLHPKLDAMVMTVGYRETSVPPWKSTVLYSMPRVVTHAEGCLYIRNSTVQHVL